MQNFFESIDLSDNELRKLGNFSFLDRLTSLILTNNRIKTIQDLSDSLPNL
jgi:Leucine-rich repeat (LRR) protein